MNPRTFVVAYSVGYALLNLILLYLYSRWVAKQ